MVEGKHPAKESVCHLNPATQVTSALEWHSFPFLQLQAYIGASSSSRKEEIVWCHVWLRREKICQFWREIGNKGGENRKGEGHLWGNKTNSP